MKTPKVRKKSLNYLHVVPHAVGVVLKVEVGNREGDSLAGGYGDTPDTLGIVRVRVWIVWRYQHPAVARVHCTAT